MLMEKLLRWFIEAFDGWGVGYQAALILFFVLSVAVLAVNYYITIMIHELGHLFFGLCTGYGFLIFRIGRWALVKSCRGYRLCVMSGETAGQCILYPKSHSLNPKYMLAGGIIFNLIFGEILILLALSQEDRLLWLLLLCCGFFDIFAAILNGIVPRKVQFYNDAVCIKELKGKEDINCYFSQLQIVKNLVDGIPYRNMNPLLFQIQGDNYSSYVADIELFNYYRLLDMGNIEEARRYIDFLDQDGVCEVVAREIRREEEFLKGLSRPGGKRNQRRLRASSPNELRLLSVRGGIRSDDFNMFDNYPFPGEVNSNRHIVKQYIGG